MSAFLKTIQIDGHGGPYKSFNDDYYLVREDTKVIIIGTITPPKGRSKGFYYMSPSNPMYRILDAYFKTSSFVNYKKSGDIPAIIDELKTNRVAFIDVIKSCNNPKNSSLDDDLEDIKLDYESFKGIDEDVVMLANSKNAYGALLIIAKHNNLKNPIKYVYGFRFYKQDGWNKAFDEIYKK